jgi:hypothetical protein
MESIPVMAPISPERRQLCPHCTIDDWRLMSLLCGGIEKVERQEISCHSYRWERRAEMAEAHEREIIAKAVDCIQKATGVRPVGWHTKGAPSPNTRRLLVEEGGSSTTRMRMTTTCPMCSRLRSAATWLCLTRSIRTTCVTWPVRPSCTPKTLPATASTPSTRSGTRPSGTLP